MKTSNKILISAVLAVFFAVPAFCAEIVEEEIVTPGPKKTAVPAATAKPTAAPTIKPTVAPAANTVNQGDLDAIKAKLEALNSSVKELRDDITALEEKNIEAGNISADLAAYKKELDNMGEKYGEDRKKVAGLEKQFTEMNDTLKGRVDKMQSWDDILDVLKKGISDNEREMAGLKKEIRKLTKQYGGDDDILNTIVQWPYAGITALVISVAAFITVMMKP
jgi:uncharacterized phage infection (PIP) family protein YhgE